MTVKAFRTRAPITMVLALVMAVLVANQSASGLQMTASKSATSTVLKIDVKGKITELNLKQIAALHPHKIKIYDPFSKKSCLFTVVNFSSVLAKAGVLPNDELNLLALDDYEFKDRASAFIAARALLAYKDDSKEIAVSRGGPVRIVFAKGSKYEKLVNAWVWSLAEINVK